MPHREGFNTLFALLYRLLLPGAIMSFGYSILAIGLGAAESWKRQGDIMGRPAPPADKAFGVFNALGNFGL